MYGRLAVISSAVIAFSDTMATLTLKSKQLAGTGSQSRKTVVNPEKMYAAFHLKNTFFKADESAHALVILNQSIKRYHGVTCQGSNSCAVMKTLL